MGKFDDKLKELYTLTEAPLGDFSLEGDWKKSAANRGFDSKSIKLLQTPITKEKYTKFFRHYPIDIDVYMFRSETGGENAFSQGVVSPEFVRDTLEWKDFKQNENNATVIFTNNIGDQKIPMTAWTAAHRLGHVMYAARHKDYAIGRHWGDVEEAFLQMINHYLYAYGLPEIRDITSPEPLTATVLTRMLGKIGTFKSARMDKIARPYEFLFEMFAQKINSDKITFNEHPEPIKYDRRTYVFDPEKFDNNPFYYSNTFEYYFDELFSNSEGKIFVM